MQISEHYLNYPRKTLIVVTNNEEAKIFSAEEREVEELEVLTSEMENPHERVDTFVNAPRDAKENATVAFPPDVDEMKANERKKLYHMLSDRLLDLLKDGYVEIILCAPEANKNELTEAMHTDVMKHIDHVVPKNLASLPLDQIIRILQETRAT